MTPIHFRFPKVAHARSLTHAAAFALMAGIGFAAPAHADPEGMPLKNVVRFSATATQEVTQDLLIVTLQANRQGPQAAEVQSGLKQLVEGALAELRKAAGGPGMALRTGTFTMQPHYNRGRVDGWEGYAQIVVEGTDVARITQAIGKVPQINVVNVSYGLSPALREQYESALTAQAIARFKIRAQQIAADFGFKSYALGDIAVSSTEPGFEPRPFLAMAMRAKVAEAADAPLPVEPGKGVLSVNVNGQVFLTP